VLTLSNTGNGALTINSITTTGDFAQTNSCISSLAANSSCQISVTFKPTVPGNRQGSLLVTDNAQVNPSPQTAYLAGVGINPTPGVSFNPTSLVFTNEPVKVTSAAQNVTLTNNGAGTLTIGSIATSGDFAQTNNCGTSLASTASCTVFVTFTPTTAGTRNGSLIFTDNGPGSPQSVPLSGTGVPAGLVTLSSNNANFPNTNVGSISAAQTVTLTNTGTASLTINSISVTFNSTNFAETNNCPASLAINANCTISITFTPASEGNSSGAISVSDNAYDTPQTISLFGVGVGALAGFDAGSLTFGTVNVGTTSASQTVHFSHKEMLL